MLSLQRRLMGESAENNKTPRGCSYLGGGDSEPRLAKSLKIFHPKIQAFKRALELTCLILLNNFRVLAV